MSRLSAKRSRIARKKRIYSEDGIKSHKRITKIRKRVLEAHNYICVYCGVFLNTDDKIIVGYGPTGERNLQLGPTYPTVDHVIPHKDGGLYTLENLVAACYQCNRKRSDESTNK